MISVDRRGQEVKSIKRLAQVIPFGRYIYGQTWGEGGPFLWTDRLPEKSCSYGYDLTDRLSEASLFDDGTAYRYDGDGQLLQFHIREVIITTSGIICRTIQDLLTPTVRL